MPSLLHSIKHVCMFLSCVALSVDENKPKFHFIPESNWMNDPNGPFFDTSTGLHHLFYQYLTPRVWGHAVSSDLVDWEILPTALNYTDVWYTQVDGSIPGVYSGSATWLPQGNSPGVPWLSASVPTNDMQLLAYPTNMSDPKYVNWTWYESNPVIYSPNESASIPPGRDPTEAYPCGTSGENRWCMAYATQKSDGCPCSGESGVVVFSSVYNASGSQEPGSWSEWRNDGYILTDTAGAVMWECPDLFPLNGTDDDTTWVLKYSIGPGPSYSQPWGVSPRDYYLTGKYTPLNSTGGDISGYDVNSDQWNSAMNRSTLVALDVGTFYASKTYYVPSVGRVLWGWLPEERPVDGSGDPYGWAGAMSLPRVMQAYVEEVNGPWYLRTPPLQSAVDSLRIDSSHVSYPAINVSSSSNDTINTAFTVLPSTVGNQLEITVRIAVGDMRVGDSCGIRVLSSVDFSGTSDDLSGQETHEYTEVGVQFVTASGENSPDGAAGYALLFVDPSNSCSNISAAVNRTLSSTYPVGTGTSVHVDAEGNLELRVLVDHSVIESFIANGARASTRRVYPASPSTSTNVQLFTKCPAQSTCSCTFQSVNTWQLRDANITSYESTPINVYDKNKHNNDESSLSDTKIVLIAIGASIGFILIFVVGTWWYMRGRHGLCVKDSEDLLSESL